MRKFKSNIYPITITIASQAFVVIDNRKNVQNKPLSLTFWREIPEQLIAIIGASQSINCN